MAEVTVAFPDTDLNTANTYAGELKDWLAEDASDVKISRKRTDDTNQDFGATLILLLGTPAAIKIGKGIANWISSRGGAKVELSRTNSDGSSEKIVIDGNLSDRSAEEIRRFIEGG